jgi:RimJ/RimL family protein N-acetyltransferase
MSIGGPRELWIDPIVLEGELVRLVPLRAGHAHDLWKVGRHPELWRWMPWTPDAEADFEELVGAIVGWAETRFGQGYATEVRDGSGIVGSTTYLNADRANRRVEIGATWITPAWQRTGVNTECKLLLMRHAFEELGANRVEFKTDSLNVQSRTAIARIGAKEEGTFRNHMVRQDGSLRHSTYYSVTVEEWPEVQENLRRMLTAYEGAPSS